MWDITIIIVLLTAVFMKHGQLRMALGLIILVIAVRLLAGG